jgi:hypothetical protein
MFYNLLSTILVVFGLYLLFKVFCPTPTPIVIDTTFPYANVSPHHPDFYDLEIPLKVPHDVKYVVYWAADGPARNSLTFDEKLAYNRFSNSGVAAIDNGTAVLRVATPQSYCDSYGEKNKPPHVNYRFLTIDGRMTPTQILVIPSDREHLKAQQLFHSSKYAYLA